MSPAICFANTICKIRSGDIRACWTVPFIMGMFAFLFPPFADFARAYDAVLSRSQLPLLEVIILGGDMFVTTFMYVFIKLGIPVEFFRFLYTFFVYYLITKIYVDITNKYQLTTKKQFYIWVFLFMQVEFFGYIDNIRTIFVRIGLLYCAYQFYFNGSNKHRYYSLFLVLIHYAYFPIVFLFFFSKYIKIKLSPTVRNLLIIFLLFGSSITSMFDLSGILSAFNFGDTINNRVMAYTEGEWSAGGDTMTDYSAAYMLYTLLLSLGSYYLLFLFAKTRTTYKLERFINPLMILCAFTITIPVMYGRYIGFFYIFSGLIVLNAFLANKVSMWEIRIYLWLCLFNTALNTFAYWNCLVNGHEIFMFLPIPVELFQTYDFTAWCQQHLSADFNELMNGNFLSR